MSYGSKLYMYICTSKSYFPMFFVLIIQVVLALIAASYASNSKSLNVSSHIYMGAFSQYNFFNRNLDGVFDSHVRNVMP